MTTALIFDTETTGLPLYGKAYPSDHAKQPRMVAIAMILIDEESGDCFPHSEYKALIRPDNWPLHDPEWKAKMLKAQNTHHLPMELLEKKGQNIADVMGVFHALYDQCDYLCAYNWAFDHKIIRGESKRQGRILPFRDRQGFCLMHAAARMIDPDRKMVSADVACQELLKRPHDKAHTPSGDLDFNIELYRLFRSKGAIRLEDQAEAGDEDVPVKIVCTTS